MKTLIALLMVAPLCACSMLNPAPSMTPEQLTAAAKDKNASVACATGTGINGKGVVTYVNVDKSSIYNGTVSVDENCKVTITATKEPTK